MTESNPFAADSAKGGANGRSGGSRSLLIAVVAVLVLGIVAFALTQVLGRPAQSGVPVAPESDMDVSVATNVVTLSKKGASPQVEVTVYFDYMCSYCSAFERANQLDLDVMLEEGTISLRLHPVSFLDQQSNGAMYSTRAANAALTVATKAPAAFQAFHESLFANQPGGGSNLTDDDLALLAKRAGVPDDVAASFSANEQVQAVQTGSAEDLKQVKGTPAVALNGQFAETAFYAKGELKAAIEALK